MAEDTGTTPRLEPARRFDFDDLVRVADGAIVSRELARTSGGTVTMFGFDAGQALSEHTAPFDALVQVIDGELTITIGGAPLSLTTGQVVLMPADVPHALRAEGRSRMLLTMLRESKAKEG